MLDFYTISKTEKGKGKHAKLEISPNFVTTRSKDLMVRGGAFYAVWNPETALWSTDEYDLRELVDRDLYSEAARTEERQERPIVVKDLKNFTTGQWTRYKMFTNRLPDSHEQLDARVVFSNTETRKEDYISRRLPYPLEPGETPAFDSLFGRLYDDEQLTKLMWAIGSIVAGDSKRIQKFYVLFGLPGTGKSTSLNLIEKLFEGYTQAFEAAKLTSSTNNFAASVFKNNPLVAIDHEGDLSRVKVNSILTSVVSHDRLTIDVKYHHPFSLRLNTSLFIATNKPVMITDKGSGLIRRLIDIRPTGKTVSARDYDSLVGQMDFELGAIAQKCLNLYTQLGKDYYKRYVPVDMLFRTNVFFNFVEEHYLDFVREDWITLKRAWELYKNFCEEAGISYRMPKYAFRDEMKLYWNEFHRVTRIDGKQIRSVFIGFNKETLEGEQEVQDKNPVSYDWLSVSEQSSIFDKFCENQPAQLASMVGLPRMSWDNVKTKLSDIDTTQLHYVLPPEKLITIDFDLKDGAGEKSLALNLEAARAFPPTYVETSKSGKGLHLHYLYDGDPTVLSRIYEPGIEILRPVGKFSIRRLLSDCNNHKISTISSGLPLKPKKGDSMASRKTIANERALRIYVLRNLHKEIHTNTKPSIDFIDKLLSDAYHQGLRYDITDFKEHVLNFAANSTNNAPYCLEVAMAMKYKSDHDDEGDGDIEEPKDTRLVFFDVEVFPNLFLVNWKFQGAPEIIRMINPGPAEIEKLLEFPLVGFNNRRYDNHMLYAAYIGYGTEEIYELSRRIIVAKDRTALFREAYGISHADVYDYTTVKQNLKRWEVELGIPYNELDIDWDKPLPEDMFEIVAEYCDDDVRATEAVHEERIDDYHAREILADLSGLRVNSTTMAHTSKIIFGADRRYKDQFKYPDLAEEFPGYSFDITKPKKERTLYRGEKPGEGGYVWARPGMYRNVLYMDIASMHPTSLEIMDLFGEHTSKYADLKTARILIKQGKLDEAGKMFNGRLAKHLKDSDPKALSYALKIALNIVYGFTSAGWDNAFKDNRNVDNVVAKRGALFMVDLKHALLERGTNVIHFKTDSVKIADYDKSDITFIKEFGKKYGYTFEVEGIYDRLVLINDAVLVGLMDGKWEAVGARFAQPYVYKSLFTKEPLRFEDYVETRAVKVGKMYLEQDNGDMHFVGRIGQFCPMTKGGGVLYRVTDDGKKYAVTATTGYKWQQADIVKTLKLEDDIDISYFEVAVEKSLEKIANFGDPSIFIGD
jgi:hypothetical protein